MEHLKAFHTISTFVKELKELFGNKYYNIQLYHRLLEKTPVTNEIAINKHVLIFSEFLRKNLTCLLEKNTDKMWDKIQYSKKVYINIKEIMNETDVETRETIWKYLLSIHFYVFQTDDVKQKLAELLSNKPGNNEKEKEFIDGFMSKIEQKFKDKEFTDPMSATQELMKSGVFTDMVQSMNKDLQEGNIDIGKLLGTVQGMIGNLSDKVDETKTPNGQPMPDISNMFSMVQNMMGMMGTTNSSSSSSSGLDSLSGLISQFQNANVSQSAIEEVNEEVE